jgi:hypothetical protein
VEVIIVDTDLMVPARRRDALGHQEFAACVARHLDVLGPGSVIALQGSWGRGKTDVLDRVFQHFKQRTADRGPAPIKIDPWRYGTPDLVRPVVVALLERLPGSGWKQDEKLKRVVQTLLRAGNMMLFKAVTMVMPTPVGEIVGAGEKPFGDLIAGLFSGEPAERLVDPDPVEVMAERFRELIQRYLELRGDDGGTMLICVDDLDRCLPDHQIAMLEAIHFLTSADARCSFLVALDPMLVQQAAIAHYGTDKFDSNKYLDKLFTIRVSLPELRDESVKSLLRTELACLRPMSAAAAPQAVQSVGSLLPDGLGVTAEQLEHAFAEVFRLPELKNPRMIHKTCDRIMLMALANAAKPDPRLVGTDRVYAIVVWCAIAERWPELRQILQDTAPSGWANNLSIVCRSYGFTAGFASELSGAQVEQSLKKYSNVQDRLPGKLRQPDLGEFLHGLVLPVPGLVTVLAEVDHAMAALGL